MNVGFSSLCRHLLNDLFNFFGSKHIRKLPSGLVTYTKLLLHTECSVTLRMMPSLSILLSSSQIFGSRFTLTFRGESYDGVASSFNSNCAGCLNLRILPNQLGYAAFSYCTEVIDDFSLVVRLYG